MINQIINIIAISYVIILADFLNSKPVIRSDSHRGYKVLQLVDVLLRGFFAGLLTVRICFFMLPVSMQNVSLYFGFSVIITGVICAALIENLHGFSGYGAIFLYPFITAVLMLLDNSSKTAGFFSGSLHEMLLCFIGGMLLFLNCGEMLPDETDPHRAGFTALGACIGFASGVMKFF